MLPQATPLIAQVADSAAAGDGVLLGLSPETQAKLLVSLLAVVALIVARRLLLRVLESRIQSGAVLYRWGKGSGYAIFVLGLLVVVQVWFSAIRSLGTFLGLVSAGLAIALKDLVADVAGWAFIMWRKPFELGDRIQVGEHAGDVVDIRVFAFSLMEIGNWVSADQSTGRIIHVPNAKVFAESLANYTSGLSFLWNELGVMVTFESDWRRAKGILQEIAESETQGVSQEAEAKLKRTSKRFLIHYTRFTPAVYTSVEDSGVMLTIRYLCHPRQRRGTAQAMWERILDAFAREDGIDLAYPTQRVYLNPIEGKADARAPWVPGPPAPRSGPDT